MKNLKLIKTLYECAAHCYHCADACLDTEDVKMMKDCIRTDRICAEICTTTAKLLAASSTNVSNWLPIAKASVNNAPQNVISTSTTIARLVLKLAKNV
ncbi:MAG: hypothetical protein WBG71_12525 [Leeuwenhoekiella sp.]